MARRAARAALAAVLWSTTALGQDFSDVEIEAIPVAAGVHMLVGRGGNIGVSTGSDGIFLIDDQYAPLTRKIRAAVAELGEGSIRFVLNTHWHGDHTGGNENLGATGALIIAHENVRSRMSVEQFLEAFGRRVPASPEGALPVVTYDEAVTFHLNGDEIRAFHVDPAHTDGDSIVHFRRANVIHMGDTFFSESYPYIDVSSGGSIDGMIAASELVISMSDANTRIIPGHGGLSDRPRLEAYRRMLRTVRGRVGAAIAEGRDLASIVESRPCADFDAEWGGGVLEADAFVRFVHASLTAQR